MRKGILVFFIAILLLSPGTFAAVGQAEGFSINAFNVVERYGIGSAEGGNAIVVGHAQEAYDVYRGVGAVQEEAVVLTQNASTAGFGGVGLVQQDIDASGGQSQVVESIGLRYGSGQQNLSVGLGSIAFNSGGIGWASGEQNFVGSQDQITITPNGINSSSQFVDISQYTDISGGPWSDVIVENNVNVDLTQGSTIIGGPSVR